MSNFLLSICIPTYNRAKYLDILLNSILVQFEPHREQIELLVSDNASSDNTRQIVDKYVDDKHLPIRYLCNASNLGPDKNIAQCFSEAAGKYAWVIGDDDALCPDALRFIMEILSLELYGIVHIKAIPYQKDFPLDLKPTETIKVIECNPEKFVRYVNIFITFVSANIVNKMELLKHYPDTQSLKEYAGTSLIQLGIYYKILKKSEKFLYIKTPLIISKTDNTGGYKLFEVFGKNFYEITAAEFGARSKITRLFVNGTILTFFPQYVFFRETLPSFKEEKEVYNLLKKYLGGFLYFWVVLYPLFKLNKSLAKMWYFLVRVMRKINALLGNALL